MNYLKILLAIGLFVIGIPGLLDDVVEWRDWMTLASWWNILLMATGLLLFVHAVFKRNLREQILKVWAYLVALFTVPDWLVEARGKQSFELYELACLIARVKPYWPLPSDEAESVYKEILQDLPEEVIYKHLTEGCSAVRNVELSRRQARECVPPKYWDYVGSGSSLRKKYPWFIREAFDQVIPDGRTDEDDRKLIAKRSDKDSDSLASRQERRNTMYDPELMIALLGEMAEQPNGRISFPVHLGMSTAELKRKHHIELLDDAGLVEWPDVNKYPRITKAGYDLIRAVDKKQGAREKFLEVLDTGAPLLNAVSAVTQLFK